MKKADHRPGKFMVFVMIFPAWVSLLFLHRHFCLHRHLLLSISFIPVTGPGNPDPPAPVFVPVFVSAFVPVFVPLFISAFYQRLWERPVISLLSISR